MQVAITVWGTHSHIHVVVMVDRHRLQQVSRFMDNALGAVDAIDLCNMPGVHVTEEHIALLLHQLQPPTQCTVPVFLQMVVICASLDVPSDRRRAIAAHMASAARIPLLRIEVHDEGGLVRHQHDIMLSSPQDDTYLLRYQYPDLRIWTLDPALGRSEVHGANPDVLRAACYQALRDVLDVGLQLDAIQPMFDLVSQWLRRNAFMFVDKWVGDQEWEDFHDCHVDFDALAPTVRAQPGQIAALMRFAIQFVDDAETVCSDYNTDEYATSFTYSEIDLCMCSTWTHQRLYATTPTSRRRGTCSGSSVTFRPHLVIGRPGSLPVGRHRTAVTL